MVAQETSLLIIAIAQILLFIVMFVGMMVILPRLGSLQGPRNPLPLHRGLPGPAGHADRGQGGPLRVGRESPGGHGGRRHEAGALTALEVIDCPRTISPKELDHA